MRLSSWFVIASLCVMAIDAVPVPLPPPHHHVSTRARNVEADHQYFDEYDVPRKFLKRKGGIKYFKSQLIHNGHVFFTASLRQLVSDAKGHFRLDINYDILAVCHGHITGQSMHHNHTTAYSLFACPSDEVQAAHVSSVGQAVQDGIQMFCCHDPPSQRCCSREEFYKTYGSLKPSVTLAMKLFLVICILMVFTVFIACIALIVCCCAVLPPGSLRGKKPKHQRPLFPAASQQQNQQLQPQDYGATNLSLGGYAVQSAPLPQQPPMHPAVPPARYPSTNLPENKQPRKPMQPHLAPLFP